MSLVAGLVALAIGMLTLASVVPRPRALPFGLGVAASIVMGLGVTSCLLFVTFALGAPRRGAVIAVDLCTLCGLAAVAARRRRDAVGLPPAGPARASVVAWPLLAVLLPAFAVVALRLAADLHQEAYGAWDAWAVWNSHARFLARGGRRWTAMFSPEITWTHADQPLLLPASIARIWLWSADESMVVPRVLAAIFVVAIIGGLASELRRTSGRTVAILAVAALLANSAFFRHAAWQYADVPLAASILLSLVFVSQQARIGAEGLVLAGAFATWAAWTKSEGQLFLACLLAAHASIRAWDAGWRVAARDLVTLVAGGAPVLLLLAFFRLHYPPPNYLFDPVFKSTGLGVALQRIPTIARAFFVNLYLPAAGVIGLLVLRAWLGTGPAPAAAWTGGLALLLTLAGYFAVYMMTPFDVDWQLTASLDRLVSQLYPGALFVAGLVAGDVAARLRRGPEPAATSRSVTQLATHSTS